MTSLARSVIWMKPFASTQPTSPVRSQPSSNLSRVGVAVVAAGDPRAADLDLADRLAVPRQRRRRRRRRCAARRRRRRGRSGRASPTPPACRLDAAGVRATRRAGWSRSCPSLDDRDAVVAPRSRSISARGTAEPPHTTKRSDERSTRVLVGVARAGRSRSSGRRRRRWAARLDEHRASGSAWRNRPGITKSAPASQPA